MKILKWLLIVIGILFALFLLLNATQDSNLQIEESMEMNASAETIYSEIIDFKGWDNWSAWNKLDPNMEKSYSGTFGELGAKNEWKSTNNQVGIGSQEVVEVNRPTYFKTKMRFEGFEADNFAAFKLEENEGKTLVTWSFEGGETPFMFRFFNLLMKPAIQQSYQQSLTDLKAIVESKPTAVANPFNLEVVEVEAQNILSIKDSTTADGISNKLAELYAEISIYIQQKKGVEMAGMPLSFYYTYSPEKVVLEAAIPYSGEAKGEGRIMAKQTPSGKAIMGIHYGDYNASEAMHYGIGDYCKDSGINISDMCWEVYANDPTQVDSADVKTIIYYPIL